MSSPSYMVSEHPMTGIVGGGELWVKPEIPPRVDIDDTDMPHRKAAVMEMLKHPQIENYGKNLEGDGDVSLVEEDIKDQKKMKKLLEELSLTEKNRDGDVSVRNEVDGNIGIGVKGGNELTEHRGLECSEGHVSTENEQHLESFNLDTEETRDLLREGLKQRLQADGMVNKVDGKLSGFPDGTYTQACFWKIVKALEKDLGLQKRFLVTKSEVRSYLQTEMFLCYGLRREG